MTNRVVDFQAILDDTTGRIVGFKQTGIPGSVISLTDIAQSLRQSATEAEVVTCAWLVANAGTYHGQRKRISDAGGNRMPVVEWNAALACWEPENGASIMHNTMVLPTIGAAVNQSINMLNPGTANGLTLPAGLLILRAATPFMGIAIDQHCELQGAPTAVTHIATLNDGSGASNLINWVGTTSRRLDRKWSMRLGGAANIQIVNVKQDNNEYAPEGNQNSNVTSIAKNAALALTLTNNVAFTNASLAATLLHCNVYLTSGGAGI